MKPKPETTKRDQGGNLPEPILRYSICLLNQLKFFFDRLKNVDRSTAMHKEVTVNNVTVVITEFRPKISSKSTSPSNLDLDAGHTTSSSSSASNHGNDLSPADQGHSD